MPLERRMNLKLVMRAARVNSNKSLSDMSAAMGVSKATISRWERGQIPIPEEAFDVYHEHFYRPFDQPVVLFYEVF